MNARRPLPAYLSLPVFILLISCTPKPSEETGPLGRKGMVVTAHPAATEVGLKILKQGGNAMDAGIAVEFALSVCYPVAGNIAGGGFWVVHNSKHAVYSLDYREKAPLAAHRDMYLGADGNVVEGMSLETIFASGVPGTVDGMVTAYGKFGSLPWPALVQPAIDLARNGFPVTANQAAGLNAAREAFLARNRTPPAFVRDSAWIEGDTLKQPDLARTLVRIRDFKREGFYGGETAELIIAQMKESGGLITRRDLDEYRAVWRKPVTGSYRGFEFYSMAPPSSGGIALCQLLGMVSHKDLAGLGFHSAASVHLLAEAERRVYADRAEYLGDPDFVEVPVERLTNAGYLEGRLAEIDPARASPSDSVFPGSFVEYGSTETTHYSIADQWGNAVAATTTLNDNFGSKIVVAGGGFLLNNQMDDFSSKPGSPNIYGLIGSSANAIMPGKRMLSCMTPTILTRDGHLFMIVGSPGGSKIITSVFQTILNVVDYGMTMQQAVSAKRFHHQWQPDYIQYEPEALDSLTIRQLSAKGHTLKKVGRFGRVEGILFRPDGTMEGGADPRGDDTAKGY